MPYPLSILSIYSDRISKVHIHQSLQEETTEATMTRFKSRLEMTPKTISRIITDARLQSQGMTRMLTTKTKQQMTEFMVSSDARRAVQLS